MESENHNSLGDLKHVSLSTFKSLSTFRCVPSHRIWWVPVIYPHELARPIPCLLDRLAPFPPPPRRPPRLWGKADRNQDDTTSVYR